ncbi:MAG: tetratricopeptide repeat protein [Anaerolineaceae bacterium]|nr:tetratricopeptide repeat protein [Anaerolineaceae bacterium]
MIKRIQFFLGPTWSRIFVVWLALTGFISLVLNVIVNDYDWVRPVQSLLVVAFVVGAAAIFAWRMQPEERGRWAGILTPAIGAILLGIFIVPQWGLLLVGGALGWIATAIFLSRSRMPQEYREAVKHLRKNRYEEAVKIMDKVIKTQPANPNHYRFRAEILRVWGKLDRARRDYVKMTQIDPESALAFNGLAEVCLQARNYPAALEAAQQAHSLAPDDWVTYYNLGMIEDRLGESAQVVEHLEHALTLKIRDERHRALIHFYLARAYSRLGETKAAQKQFDLLKHQQNGLDEWDKLLKSEQADTLRAALGTDIETAQQVASGQLDLAALAGTEAIS